MSRQEPGRALRVDRRPGARPAVRGGAPLGALERLGRGTFGRRGAAARGAAPGRSRSGSRHSRGRRDVARGPALREPCPHSLLPARDLSAGQHPARPVRARWADRALQRLLGGQPDGGLLDAGRRHGVPAARPQEDGSARRVEHGRAARSRRERHLEIAGRHRHSRPSPSLGRSTAGARRTGPCRRLADRRRRRRAAAHRLRSRRAPDSGRNASSRLFRLGPPVVPRRPPGRDRAAEGRRRGHRGSGRVGEDPLERAREHSAGGLAPERRGLVLAGRRRGAGSLCRVAWRADQAGPPGERMGPARHRAGRPAAAGARHCEAEPARAARRRCEGAGALLARRLDARRGLHGASDAGLLGNLRGRHAGRRGLRAGPRRISGRSARGRDRRGVFRGRPMGAGAKRRDARSLLDRADQRRAADHPRPRRREPRGRGVPAGLGASPARDDR